MRRTLVIAAAAGLVASLVGVVPVHSATLDPSLYGGFSAPFREDGFTRGPSGCKDAGNGKLDCLPAAVSVVSLPDGRILYWNALEGFENVKTHAVLEAGDLAIADSVRVLSLNPAGPASSSAWAGTTPGDGGGHNKPGQTQPLPGQKVNDPDKHSIALFCADQKLLPDGRVLAVGGTDFYQDPRIADGVGVIELQGAKTVRIFDPTNNTWQEASPMRFARWYPSMVTLADGKIFVASGVTKLIKPVYPKNLGESGANVKQTETYDVAADKWTANYMGDRSLPLYPRLHLLPNGKVFYDAAGQAFNPAGEAYDEALWNLAAVFDPAAKGKTPRWTDLGIPGVGTAAPGFRGSTFSAPLRLDPPYDTARFLTAGGVIGTTPGTVAATTDSRISEVKVQPDNTETFTTYATSALKNARWFSTAVPLPDGSVMAFSGADIDEVVAPGYETGVQQAELFTPRSDGHGGIWRRMASSTHARTYHNNAVLLPDGRVLVGGHAPVPNGDRRTENTPNVPGRKFANNFHDASLEIFTPPYATRDDRPTITGYEPVLERGASTVIGVDGDAGMVDTVVLMRNPSQTHLIDGDARSVSLKIIGRDAHSVHVAVPDNPAVLPPGPYYLFVNNLAEDFKVVPSVGKQVFVGTPATPGFVADTTGNVTFASSSASPSPTGKARLADLEGAPAHRPTATDPAPSFLTRLIHHRGAADGAAIAVGVAITWLWLANRGRRRRAGDSSAL